MLQNDYLVAKIGFDTADNEPSKVSGASEFHPIVSHTGPTPCETGFAAGCAAGREGGLGIRTEDRKRAAQLAL